MELPAALPVSDMTRVGEARRLTAALTVRLGFTESGAGQAAIVVTEIASNLVKHAHDGLLVLRPLDSAGNAGLEILALDKGPGMIVARCLRDGFSTTSSPGTGLGAISRLAAFLDIYSTSGGTALVARLWATTPPPPAPEAFNLGVVSVPIAGEVVCGDNWAVERVGENTRFLVVDGLGHGPDAALAAATAVRAFRTSRRPNPAEVLEDLHRALKSTRGAAAAVAVVDRRAELIHYAGLGNISATVLAGAVSRSMVSHNGTVGHEARKFQTFVYPFPATATLVMHSDGIATQWDLDAYAGLIARDPALVAGILHRDFRRARDDSTVLVARAAGGVSP